MYISNHVEHLKLLQCYKSIQKITMASTGTELQYIPKSLKAVVLQLLCLRKSFEELRKKEDFLGLAPSNSRTQEACATETQRVVMRVLPLYFETH